MESTSLEWQGPSRDPVPGLDGVLVSSEPELRGAADDFGHVVSRRPSAVLRPGSVDDIARTVQFARRHGVKIGPRGRAHAMYGHAQVQAGIVIDMGSLSEIHSMGEDRVDVDAGISWSELVARTLPQGLTPPILTDYLNLSVGGTLSMGGVSGASFRHGVQVDNVLELHVVTGEGRRVTCSPTLHRELFEATLAGMGQCGIIVRATLRLLPAPTHVRVFDLGYADPAQQLQDELRAIEDGRFDYVVGCIVPMGGQWMYRMLGIAYYTPPARPEDARLLEGLSYQRGSEQIMDCTYFEFLNRLVPPLAEVERLGLLAHPHPWCDLLVPASRLEEFLGQVLQEVAHAELSPYFPILLYPFKRDRLTRPLFRVPEEDTFFLVDILRTASPETVDAARMVAHNRQLFERNRSWGGTHYAISAIPLSHEDWRRHYGSVWEGFAAAKRRYDPDNVLTPGPGIFGPGALQ
ncbi:FAD-binding protein [Hyalangium gracile]|uniref:FAD-binding protein n=1 Tax=Hyalangium gracile TaxID=394092 RepID=UPI001CCFBEA2|nr:FAD-binding protein [Hyalangium gracile]